MDHISCLLALLGGLGEGKEHEQSRTGASAQAAGLREGGRLRVRPAASRREAPRAHPQWPSAAVALLPTEERAHEKVTLFLKAKLMKASWACCCCCWRNWRSMVNASSVPRLQLEVHVVLGWAKYSYLARTLGNFAGQDHRQGVQSCPGKRFACDTLQDNLLFLPVQSCP
jgi:hypothetical protein